MSTVEKVVRLDNGVTLGEALEYIGTYKLTKDEARAVFLGTVEDILCHCAIRSCEIPDCGALFAVERDDEGGVFIGCVYFNAEQVTSVKKWLEGRE